MNDFLTTLGIRHGATAGEVLLDAGPKHDAGHGSVHFAVLATMAEVGAAAAAERPLVPANVAVSLLAPAACPGTLVARGRVLRAGRRLVVAEGEVFQEDRLVAKAVVTFVTLD